jgi:NCAIR mutase (PurE)-related protein
MHPQQILEIMSQLARGEVTPEAAATQMTLAIGAPTGETPFAQVDLGRAARCGFPEVVYSPGKTSQAIAGIFRKLLEHGQDCFATRVSDEQARDLLEDFPQAQYNPTARTLRIALAAAPETVGGVAVVTAGTSDLPVAEEALETVRWMGCGAELIVDVGVAGPQRLLAQLPRLRAADVIVVAAGMEGALPSVVGGHVRCPVIAVPTSVGYGASFGGVAALLGMLNSCAANVTVVNIDAGFKAGFVAGLIARGRNS